MTPEQCRDLAKFHEHMAEWFQSRWSKPEAGVVTAIFAVLSEMHRESARYWREKTGE